MKNETRQAYGLWFRVAGLVLVVTALVAFVTGFYSKKFHLETGPAQWIWIDHPLDERKPIAFFVVRDIVVPPNPPFVRLRVACDGDWTFYLNGVELAGGVRTNETRLVELDLTGLPREGEVNRLAFALRSATGVGGLLASVDYAPLRENDVVTSDQWRICRSWQEAVLLPGTQCSETPIELGAPPLGRWDYPVSETGRLYAPAGRARPAESVTETEILRSEIRVLSGIAIESPTAVPARLFDFGIVEARGRLTLDAPAPEVRLVQLRYALQRDEPRARGESREIVFAPGESTVTDPQERTFRYIAVADPGATAWAVPRGDTGDPSR